jgi:CheY-like chemotaxis protein
MYKIVYIDECQDDIEAFLDYFEDNDSKNDFNIETLFPVESIEEMIDLIFQKSPDAIISDFQLNEYKTTVKYNVPYTGVQLSEKIFEEKHRYPCFVLTSYDDDAIKKSQDVNIVYIKDILHGINGKSNAQANFLGIIKHQILHYRSRISNAEKELLELIKKSNTKDLNAEEEARLLELDDFIEKSTNKKSALPNQLKGTKNLDALHALIANTDELLKELKRKNTDSSPES